MQRLCQSGDPSVCSSNARARQVGMPPERRMEGVFWLAGWVDEGPGRIAGSEQGGSRTNGATQCPSGGKRATVVALKNHHLNPQGEQSHALSKQRLSAQEEDQKPHLTGLWSMLPEEVGRHLLFSPPAHAHSHTMACIL